MVKNLAKKAMTTKAQKACYVIDHLVEALGNEPSSSLRRALILVDIDQYPGATQSAIMERMHINKSALNREIEWLFNYGCITRQEAKDDARTIKLHTCGYSKKSLNGALDYFDGDHQSLKGFLKRFNKFLELEKPVLRDAKIITIVHEKGQITKQDLMSGLYGHVTSTDHRAINKLLEQKVIRDD